MPVFGEEQAALRKIQRRQRPLRCELHSHLSPVQAPRDHQVKHKPEVFFDADCNAFAKAADHLDGFPFHILERGPRGAEQEGAGNADTFEPLMEDALLQGFDVNDDIREFRHDFAILARGATTVNPRVLVPLIFDTPLDRGAV